MWSIVHSLYFFHLFDLAEQLSDLVVAVLDGVDLGRDPAVVHRVRVAAGKTKATHDLDEAVASRQVQRVLASTVQDVHATAQGAQGLDEGGEALAARGVERRVPDFVRRVKVQLQP